MSAILTLIHGWSVPAVVLRLILAMIVGVVIGIERQYRNRGAGIKTHVLVCIGAALAMIVGQYITMTFPGESSATARLGAQVIGGVGFLGVGTIIVTGINEVRGLSTASGLWACACTGLAAGIGYVEGTIIALLLIIFTYMVLGRADLKMNQFSKECNFYVELAEGVSMRDLFLLLRREHVRILHFQHHPAAVAAATVFVELPKRGRRESFLAMLSDEDWVDFLEEL